MFLLKWLVKDYENTASPVVRERYGTLSGVCGVVLNLILSVMKFLVGAATQSVAIMADAFNNLTDCLTSVLTILGFRWAAKPADREHPFGHARIEYVISLAVAGIILVTGYEVMRSAIASIIDPADLYFTRWAVVVMGFSMGVKLWMMVFNNKLGRAIDSDTLKAVGVDSRNDVLINAVALFSLIFVSVTDINIDGYIGGLLALVFLRSGYGVAKEALGRIIGHPSDISVAQRIKEVVKAQEGVLGVHDLVVHNYGHGRDMASIHVEVPVDMKPSSSFALVEQINFAVQVQLGIPIAVQLSPIDLADERLQRVIGVAQSYIASHHVGLHPHEFRMVEAKPRPVIVFDLEFPLVVKRADALALRESIRQAITTRLPEYDCEINIEYSYAA